MSTTTDLRFECVHCGKCCTDLNTLVNTTYLDILRIRDGLNLTQDEVIEILCFYLFEKKPTTGEMERIGGGVPPIETERGLAFAGLKKKSSGQCYFYNSKTKRCTIYEFRPNFCRTFPFTFKITINRKSSGENTIEVFYTEKGLQYCQGIGDKSPTIEKDNWVQLGHKVIQDMTKNTILIKKWNESVKKKIIIPSVRNFILTILNLDD